MRRSRREELEKQAKRNSKYQTWPMNTATVDSQTGEVFARDDHVRELVEERLYYSPKKEGWLVRAIRGITVRVK